MADDLRFEVLGPLRIIRGGVPVPTGGRVQQRVLALLLATPNTAVSDDRLIEEVWDGEPPPSAHHLLQVYVSRLRAILGDGDTDPRIAREGSGYRLEVGAEQVDAVRFVDAVTGAAPNHDPAQTEKILDTALAMWRGRPFGDLGDDMPTVRMEADRLEELSITAREHHCAAGLELGRHQDLVPVLHELTERYPYRQLLWAQEMTALYRCGREAEALRTYTRLRRLLAEELGIEPSRELQRLEEQILFQDPGLSLEPREPPSNLPIQLTSFVGRTAEVTDLVLRMADARLVTLTGVGGIGKTRLAIAGASERLPIHPDGVWWVDLSPVASPRAPGDRVAAALGVGSQPGLPLEESIIRAMSHRNALLVLDNCEQVAEEAGSLVAKLLAGCGRLSILATSRIPLDVAGEVLWSVPPLSQPTADSALSSGDVLSADSARLFVERASAASRSFQLDDGNATSIATICRRLDGLPLAIEMAASRVAVLSPAQIVDRLDDRFDLLHGPRHPEVSRHETLQAALDWSYELLDDDQQVVFDHLAIFVRGFDLAAVEAVCGPELGTNSTALETVTALVTASLVTVESTSSASASYRMLETVRAYATRRLEARDGVDRARQRHSAHYLDLVQTAGSDLFEPGFASWIVRLEEYYDEIRAALGWSLLHQPREITMRSVPTLFEYWYRQAKAEEAGIWGRAMLEGSGSAPAGLRAAAHTAVAFGDVIGGDLAGSVEHGEEAIELYRRAGDERGLVQALFTRAQAALALGDFAKMSACGREALEICERLGGRWWRARPLTVLAFAEMFGTGNLSRAADLLRETLPLYRELGDHSSEVVFALTPLCSILVQQGDVRAAEGFALEAVAVSGFWEGSALCSLADVLSAKGDVAAAEAVYLRGVARSMDVGLENWLRINLRNLSRLAALREEHEEAARLWGASSVNMPQWGAGIGLAQADEVRQRLGEERFDRMAAEGSSWSHLEIRSRYHAGP